MAPPKNPRKPQKGTEAKETPRKGREKNSHPKSRKLIRKSEREREQEREQKRERTQKQRGGQYILDYARLHNGLELELPEEEDFIKYSAVPRRGFYVKVRQLRKEVKKKEDPPQPQSSTASAPWVPSPYDNAFPKRPYWAGDDDELEDEQEENQGRSRKRARTGSNMSAKRQRYYKKFSSLSQEFIFSEDESDEEEIQIPEHVVRKTPATFMGIPREIRLQILHSILTVQEPIQVFSGWKQLYWKEDLRLSTGILRVCKSVYEEACTVLYGANTFLYLLRDPSSEADAIDSLATDDSSQAVDEPASNDDDDDLDYEEEGVAARPARPPKERTINIAKYAHLFRKINIKAEANRYSSCTLQGMAAAIKVFARKVAQDGIGWEKDAYFIHTLTVSVTPTSNQQGKNQEPNFTFVNFFVPGSPVLSAIKAVDCQLLRIDILTSETKRGKTCYMSGTGSCRLELNRIHERLCDNREQISSGDGGNKIRRWREMKLAKMSEKKIDELAKHIAMFCKQRGFGQRTTESMDVDSPYWNDFEDEDEDDF
ncbi:hypothetical protein CCMA1212_005777 [Trichoderma ghanense]|uniref:Uncharacterized protein n=1 Tax=Trichoderma ghanense TaxID=65468 RepID=A0ABY2H2Q4_9HYPO